MVLNPLDLDLLKTLAPKSLVLIKKTFGFDIFLIQPPSSMSLSNLVLHLINMFIKNKLNHNPSKAI